VATGRYDTDDLRLTAQKALDLAFAEPRRALSLAEIAANQSRRARDWLALSLSRQAEGLALRCLEQPQESVRALESAVRAADRGGHTVQAAKAQVSLALSLGFAGRNRHALRVLDRAEAVLDGVERARAQVQRATLLCWIGRPRTAMMVLPAALDEVRRAGDRLWQARALSSTGLAQVELGDLRPAESALEAAEQLFLDLAQHADAAGNRHNRGWCATLLGDIPAALEHYGVAEQRFLALGLPVAELQLDRARLLLAAGLAHEACAVASKALEQLSLKRASGGRAEALLVLSEILLQLGDPAAAQATAADAVQALRRQKRAGRTAVAKYTQLYAAWLAGQGGRTLYLAARRLAPVLERNGLHATARDARMLAGRAAFGSGDHEAGRIELELVARDRRRGSARLRSQSWLAEALLRLDGENRRGAGRALREALRVMEAHRASIGALELRARMAAQIEEVAALGRRLALDSGRAEQLLRWTEYGRAVALRLPPVRPPADPELAADLAQLRRLGAGSDSDAARARLQERIKRRTRQLAGAGAALAAPQGARQLADALGTRTLVSFVLIDDCLYAVTLMGGRLRRWSLASAAQVHRELEFVLAAQRRSVRAGRPGRLADADGASLRDAVGRLDALLLRPIHDLANATELVITSPSVLNNVPWSLLPTASARPITVTPSATAWHAAIGQPRADGHVVLVAGPDLVHATAEIADLATVYPEPIVLTGDDAAVAAACQALDGASTAHLAAHGESNMDNPLFSSLRLADGPLMTYDLGQLGAVPDLVVLSACDSLAGAVYGDELLGMATALLQLGAQTVIGSLAPLPDLTARPAMYTLHQRLARGDPPATALQRARESVDADTAIGMATAGALICLGIG